MGSNPTWGAISPFRRPGIQLSNTLITQRLLPVIHILTHGRGGWESPIRKPAIPFPPALLPSTIPRKVDQFSVFEIMLYRVPTLAGGSAERKYLVRIGIL